MPVPTFMTWNARSRTWFKKFNRKQYAVSCLGLQKQLPTFYRGDTEKDSRQAANEWWRRKSASLSATADNEAEWDRFASSILSWQNKLPEMVSRMIGGRGAVVATCHTINQAKADFLSACHAKVGVEITAGRYSNLERQLEVFTSFADGTKSIDTINEALITSYTSHWYGKVKNGGSTGYAAAHLKALKQFVRWCDAQAVLTRLPRNLSSAKITVLTQAVKCFSVQQIAGLLAAPMTERTRLFVLLQLNTGMTQRDIAELKQEEVDWIGGTITRKRSKTDKYVNVPVVTYPLWASTFSLLLSHRSADKVLALTNRSGTVLVTEELVAGKRKSTDDIAKAWQQISSGCKVLPMKYLRKTSATLLAGNRDFATVADLFLGHAPRSIAEKHYKAAPMELLAEAVNWLAGVYGVK